MRIKFTLAAAACLIVIGAPLAQAACQDNYAGASQPHFTQTLSVSIRELCFTDFAVGHSATTHTALWSAEHLTAGEIEAARALPRRDTFHAERALPANERAELADYAHSGFDRGHLTPSGDMPTPQAQSESFTLANVVPQNSTLNRGLWENIEVAVRDLAERDGELFVVTGPIFAVGGDSLRGRVRVPTAMFKAVYDPHLRQAAAYIANNARGATYRVVSIAQLREMTGIDVFPSLPQAIKARTMLLPDPEHPDRVYASRGAPPVGALER